MRPRKLTVDRLPYIRAVIAIRRVLPTHAELARAEGVSKSLIDQIAAGVCYKERVPEKSEGEAVAVNAATVLIEELRAQMERLRSISRDATFHVEQ